MKRWRWIVLAACAVALAAPLADAAKGDRTKKKNTPQTVPSDAYAQYDKNGNGILDADEKDAMRKALAAEPNGLLKAYDTNGDGKLSDEEIAAIPATKAADVPVKKKKKKQ